MSTQQSVLQGVGVGRGAVWGPVAAVRPAPVVRADEPVPVDRTAAKDKLFASLSAVAAGLRAQAQGASATVADVLKATAQMADDPALRQQTGQRIDEGEPPLHALVAVIESFAGMFTAAGGYHAERVTDLNSVLDRVVARYQELPEPGVPPLPWPAIIVAPDLSPADTAAMDLDKVLGIVIEQGGPTGHTAIIAGQLGLPCVVRATGASMLVDGDIIAIDAAHGTVTIDPDEATRAAVEVRRAGLATLAEATGDGATADGHRIALLANIGTAVDAEHLTDAAVEGVGLFRTEVLFLGATTAPTEDDQATVYVRALTALGGRKVVLRTLDAGADKPLAFVDQAGEENPALGVRGFRLVRHAEGLIRTQLQAIARAAKQTGDTPWVMAPMIATVEEARQFASMARGAGIATVGVMVEVPAAALRAKDILAEVDFVSLGTNDLAQYTMATDRLLGSLVDLLDAWQPAVLDLVAATAAAGVETGKPVGVCGESASDPMMALLLTGLGITSLSMSPSAVPAVRFALSRHDLATCKKIGEAARRAPTAGEARAAALALVDPQVREVLALG